MAIVAMQPFPMMKFGHRLVEVAEELLAHDLDLPIVKELQIGHTIRNSAGLFADSTALESYLLEALVLRLECCNQTLALRRDFNLR